jgi:hypothetical protein
VAREYLKRAAHGGGRRRRRRRSSRTGLQWKLGRIKGSSSTSKSRGSWCERWLGRRRSGVSCPRAGGARPERKGTAAAECSLATGNWTREVTEQQVGVDVVLLRARGRGLRHRGGLSTVTRRWRPEEARGWRGARACGQERRGKRSERRGDDAWRGNPAGGGAREAVPAVDGGDRSRAEGGSGAVRGRRSREVSGDLFAILKKFRDPTVN